METVNSIRTALLLLGISASVVGHVTAQQVRFSSPIAYAAGVNPRGTTVADLNRDGHLDVVTANEGGGNISILLSDGAGGFLEARMKGDVVNALTVVVFDFDEDGWPDIAVPSRGTGSVAVFRNLGDGSFADANHLQAGVEPFAIASADLDFDGHADIAATNVQGASISIFFGDGLGGFSEADSVPVGGGPHGIAVADLNEDGAFDLAVINAFIGTLAVCLNDGAGLFPSIVHIPVGSYPAFIVVQDFSEDGHLDVAILDADRSELSVLFGDGGGGFGPPTVIENSGYFWPGDFDLDGHVDLAATTSIHEIGRPLVLWKGDGTGQFENAGSFEAGIWAYDPCAGDLDEDGQLDVALTDTCSGEVLVLRNETFDAIGCAKGNVNAALGDPVDVLFVNGITGDALTRTVSVERAEPFLVSIDVPPSRSGGRAPFVLYGWLGRPEAETRRVQPAGLGTTCMPTPLNRVGELFDAPQPREIWKNIPHHPELGIPTRPSTRAPSTVLDLRRGLGVSGTFFLQGFILDAGAPNGIAAITNGVVVVAR